MTFQNDGYCCCCEKKVRFRSEFDWFRDHYRCTHCHSIPRERALMHVIETYFPDWRRLTIHEPSPVSQGASLKLRRGGLDYIPSQYLPGVIPGATQGGIRCENLESLTFADEAVDLHVSQDIVEHLFHPERVFQEVARTLRPGGAHVFTVPLVRKFEPSRRRASLDPHNGRIVHHLEPEYHGNPMIDQNSSLVVWDWGYDIGRHIFQSSGLFTQIISIENLELGIKAEYNEVLITYKPAG